MSANKRVSALVMAVIGMFVAGFALSASASAYPPGISPTIALSVSTTSDGLSVGVTLANFNPHSSTVVTFPSSSVTVTTDANGAASTTITTPLNESAGTHQICATDAQGATACASITVVASTGGTGGGTSAGSTGGGSGAGGTGGGGGGGLAGTGVAVIGIVVVGVLLLLGGGVMLLTGKRRKTTA
jgi:hypothetical protein